MVLLADASSSARPRWTPGSRWTLAWTLVTDPAVGPETVAVFEGRGLRVLVAR